MCSKVPQWLVLFLVTLSHILDVGDTVGLHKEGNEFCYSDPDCGPESNLWAPECHRGQRQSPISLPHRSPVLPGITALHLNSYRCDSFRMQNTGHTVHVEFLEGDAPPFHNFLHGGGDGPSHGTPFGTLFPFPDPFTMSRYGDRAETAYYKFDSAHFHWGRRDEFGSEHCFDERCFSMELHLVHHLSTYDTMSQALDSDDPNALAVIAVMLDVTPAAGVGNPALAPIVNNIFQIEEPSHDDWAYIHQPLDLSRLLSTPGPQYMFSYKGSLTTPDCNEQVNWYVFKKPIAISHRDVHAFRFLNDNRGEQLIENHRPIQPRNGRPVYLSQVKPIH